LTGFGGIQVSSKLLFQPDGVIKRVYTAFGKEDIDTDGREIQRGCHCSASVVLFAGLVRANFEEKTAHAAISNARFTP
jgi:hypothetical protein